MPTNIQNKLTPQVDGFIRKNKAWQAELQALREIALSCGLTEEIKWRQPCYTTDGKNVVLLGNLKDCCTLSFLKGALLDDPKGLLVAPGENSRSARYLKFADVDQIKKQKKLIKAYIQQAIDNEKAGKKVDLKSDAQLDIPAELQAKFDEDAKFKAAFEKLTPGRQRGYILHFTGAKQSKTITSRIEKSMPKIFEGIGYNEYTK
ncbi:MAG: YdeI family protein [Phycisphaeraceae bacterium JB051]